MHYLLDHTILHELYDAASAWHPSVCDAVETLIQRGHSCHVDRSGLWELWMSLTRPAMLNGLGVSPGEAQRTLISCTERFHLLQDPPPKACLEMATRYDWMGDGIQLAQQVVAMQGAGVTHLLTLDPPELPEDLAIEIVLLDPREVD